MEENGQLNFSDDPLLPGLNEAYSYLETGDFEPALRLFDELLTNNLDYPGIEEGYRTTRFWLNRFESIAGKREGLESAEFLLREWENFLAYASEHSLSSTQSYRSVEKYIYYTAAEHYKIAFQSEENPSANISMLLNLSVCFLKLSDYRHAIDTLEFARSSYRSNPKLLAMLAEAYYQVKEIPKALLLFREAFFIDPGEIDLSVIKAEPVVRLKEFAEQEKSGWGDIREWIPVFGQISDIFYVKRHLNRHTIDAIGKEIYSLELSYQSSSNDRLRSESTLPRLLNRYLWLFDYYKEQEYHFDNLTEIRSRLIEIDSKLFTPYFRGIKL